MKIEKNDFIYLEKPLSPKLILWFYWVSVVLTFLGAVLSMFEEGFTFLSFMSGIFIFIFGFLFLRFFMELMLMPFRIENHLKDLKSEQESLKVKDIETDRD